MKLNNTYTFKITLTPTGTSSLVEQLTYSFSQLLDEYKLNSLVHFCQTGKFLDELDK